MKICSVNDEQNHCIACVLIESEEVSDVELLLVDHWGPSTTEGMISILGSQPSKEFTDHIQNYAAKEKKWIISSLPIIQNACSDAFCLQIISKKNCPEKIEKKLEPFQFESNSAEEIFKPHSKALLILDRGTRIQY